jgi:transposase-like protein
MSRITEDIKQQVIECLRGGASRSEVARLFDIAQATISRIESEVGLPRGTTKREMDARFQQVLMAAVANGSERCPTLPSTEMGTRHPVVGYTRE